MKKAEKSPAFQFYPRDFLSDINVISMNLEQLGAYIRLLCICWLEGELPNDLMIMERLCGYTGQNFEAEIWLRLRQCFYLSPSVGSQAEARLSKWRHKRLDAERQNQLNFSKKMSDAGKRGAKVRRVNNLNIHSQAIARLQPGFSQALAKTSSASALSTKALKDKDKTKENAKSVMLCASRPTAQQTAEYFQELSHPEEAEKFFDYFQANGWKVGGRAAMKDWRAAARNWVRRVKPTDKFRNMSRAQRNTLTLLEEFNAEKDTKHGNCSASGLISGN